MQVDSWQVRGNFANAGAGSWSSSDPNCWSASGFYLWGSDETSHSQGAPVSSTYGGVDFYDYGFCDGRYHYAWGWSPLDADHLTMTRLSEAVATVDTTTTSWGYSCDEWWNCTWAETEALSLQGTITLTGVGDTFRGASQNWYGYSSGTYRYNYRTRYNGSSRDATVAVNLTLGGAPFSFNDAWGSLANSNSGAVFQYKY